MSEISSPQKEKNTQNKKEKKETENINENNNNNKKMALTFDFDRGYDVIDIGTDSSDKSSIIGGISAQSGQGGVVEENPRDMSSPDHQGPRKQSQKSKKVKWTAQYIVWLVLIIMVGVFALGIFLLLYWWCCHARTYRYVDSSNFPQAAYTQLQTNGNHQIYGAMEGGNDVTVSMAGTDTTNTTAGATNTIPITPIDDTMVSQTVTVEADVLP